MKAKYAPIPFFYDLIDILYFNRARSSPRTALLGLIPDTQVRVLDVCAGTGTSSLLIAKHKDRAKITALDLSSDMLNAAGNKFRRANIENVEILVGNACNTGFGDDSFDVVLLSLVLHESSEYLRQAMINEAKRVLNTNGRMIVVEWAQPKSLLQRLMFSLIKCTEPSGFKDFLHTDLASYFRTFGLTVLEKKSCDYTQIVVLSKQHFAKSF